VSNYGQTTLTNCTVSGNTAIGIGGGLASSATPFGGGQDGTLTLTNCTISGNTASIGGGVATSGGAVAFYVYGGGFFVSRRTVTPS
jgi:hypothetical protein